MLSLSSVLLGFSIFNLNVFSLPANVTDLEARATTSMTDTINSYIDLIVSAGFKPNGAPASKRDDSELDAPLLMERDNLPNGNLVLNLLGQHGFKPPTTTTTTGKKTTRDESSGGGDSPLEKRTLPDINLVVSLLKSRGFYPTGQKTARSLEARQDPQDVNTVINQLVAQGYQASDFSGSASTVLKTLSLPTSTTATCPKDNNTIYATGGQQYQVNCGWDYKGTELPPSQVSSLAACLAACAKVSNCVAANWAPSTTWCYPKSAISNQILDSRYTTAKNVKAPFP